MNLTRACLVRSPSKLVGSPTVLVVDSDASVRESLELMTRSAGWQVRTFASAEEFLARPRVTAPCCLLVELHLPGLSGLELQKRVFERTEMPVIFMSGHADVRATVQAMKGGAFEFLTKPLRSEVLARSIGDAMEHSRAALHQRAQIRTLQERYDSLSRREREVMNLVITGRLNKQVGGELGISEITVKAHRGKMMRKMQAGSFAELVTMAANLPDSASYLAGRYVSQSGKAHFQRMAQTRTAVITAMPSRETCSGVKMAVSRMPT